MESHSPLSDIRVFFVSFKRHINEKCKKIPDLLQNCIYEGENELTDSDLNLIKTSSNDFKLTHIYKYNTGVQILGGEGGWKKHVVIGQKSFDDWHFNEPYFAIDGVYESDVYKIFNSTKDISNTVEIIDATSNLKIILDKERIGVRKKARDVGTVKLLSFIHDTFFYMIWII